MANWCSNHVSVTGDNPNVQAFVNEIIELSLKYRKIEEGVLPEYCEYLKDGYLFFDNEIYEKETTDFSADNPCFNYSTQWSPNLAILKCMAEHHKVNIESEYEEMGMQIYGKWTYNDGIENDVWLEQEDFDLYTEYEENYTYTYKGEVYNSEWEVLELILENKIAELKKQHFLTNKETV
ncbi:MAG TPA: hypothetical protein PLJ18_11565 [Niabella sp.]|nr:hypothetical protein [Bacteroidia bacterium]HRB52080.1 hypothetical protein [Bacteroidia bacterium]HRC03084.1 hypothetical protein [Niabella sp.]